MKITKTLAVATFIALFTSATEGVSAEPDKWTTTNSNVTDVTFDFPASPSFSVEIAHYANASGAIAISGTGTLSSPQVSPPHTGQLAARWNLFGWTESAATTCLQIASAHAALPPGSPRHFVLHVTTQGMPADHIANGAQPGVGIPNMGPITGIICTER
jgi:hypothetical protein